MTAHQFSLDDFLGMVLRGIARDLPGLRGADIAALRPERPHHQPVVLAAQGVARMLQEIQLGSVMGPTCSAAATHVPVTSKDLWHDRRWPKLDLYQACLRFPEHSRALHETRGTVALPGLRDNGSLVVVSAYLTGAPDDGCVGVMSRYERLVTSALATTSAFSGPEERTRRVLAILQSRDDIQQATGIVMSASGTDPRTAMNLLYDIGIRSGVRPTVLAVELIGVVGESSAATTNPKARRIAHELWATLKHVKRKPLD